MLNEKQTAHKPINASLSSSKYNSTPEPKLAKHSALPQIIPFMNLSPGRAVMLKIVSHDTIPTTVIITAINVKVTYSDWVFLLLPILIIYSINRKSSS